MARINEAERVKPYADIIKLAELFNAGTEFDDDNNLIIRHSYWEAPIIARRIRDIMDYQHPDKEYLLTVIPDENIIKVKVY